jgi:predicted transcriptional regulator
VPNGTNAIISIHPTHAEAILAGTKTIELRRRIPKLLSGTKLWIYATRPTAAIIGVATIADVARAHPKTIWKHHRNGAGVDHDSFKEYFNGSQEGFAILLAAVKRVGPVTIDQLRGIRDRFHPPQVITVLTSAEAKALRSLAKK